MLSPSAPTTYETFEEARVLNLQIRTQALRYTSEKAMREYLGQCQCSATESKDKAAKPSPIKRGKLIRVPDNKLTRRTNARPSVSTFLAISDDDSNPSGIGEQANTVDNEDQEGSPSLRFYVDNSAWDVIHKELMDWRDSSWSSMHLPESQMCKRSVFS